MKKILVVFLTFLLVFAMTGCTKGKKVSYLTGSDSDNNISSEIKKDDKNNPSNKNQGNNTSNVSNQLNKNNSASDKTSTSKVTVTNSSDNVSSQEHIHIYGDWETEVKSDCRTMGEQKRSCSCGETERATIPKTSHNYINNVCSICGDTKVSTFVSDTPAAQANTIGAERGDATVTAQGDWLYFANGKNIVKAKKNGSGRKTVYTVSAGRTGSINIIGDWIYFCVEGSKRDNSYIAKVRTDGAEFEKILNGVLVPEMLIIKDQMFFTTLVNPYTNYAKDSCPLYLMSASGGLAKQVHDGYVNNLIADSKYVYFRYSPLNSGSSICRMKHDAKSVSTLLSNKEFNYFVVQNSRLYYTTGGTDDGCNIVSISINGGSITTHVAVPYCSEWIAVIGQKLYFNGMPYKKGSVEPDDMSVGVYEFNLSSKRQNLLLSDFDNRDIFAVKNRLFVINGENSYSVYDPSTQKWIDITI